MRPIVVFDHVSADGYFADANGGLGWTVQDPELDRGAKEGMPENDTILFGRRTYEMFESFWPHALDDSDTSPDPHRAGRRSPELRAMAVFINEATKIVFSRSRKDVTWRNSRLVPELDPREIAEMKRQPGKGMIVFGSGSIVSQLTEHGLVDEYHLVVAPVLLGAGRTLLNGVPKSTKLELCEARAFPSGNVKLRWKRAG